MIVIVVGWAHLHNRPCDCGADSLSLPGEVFFSGLICFCRLTLRKPVCSALSGRPPAILHLRYGSVARELEGACAVV